MKKHSYIAFVFLLAFCACTSRRAGAWLECAKQHVETQPEMALAYIDSITYPRQDLSAEGYRQYTVTKVQAMYMLFKNVAYETDIYDACDYYNSQGKDYKKIALANLYCGCVYEENDQIQEAMEAYKRAFDAARQTNDSLLMGRAQQYRGRLFDSQGLYQESLEAYRHTMLFYNDFPNKIAKSYALLGRAFLLLHEKDSAIYYYNKGVEKTRQIGDTVLLGVLFHNIGVAYRDVGDYKQAEYCLRQSIALNPDNTQTARYYLNFAKLYQLMQQDDSCSFYENLLKTEVDSIDDPYLLSSVCLFLSQRARIEHDHDAAYLYLQKNAETNKGIWEKRMKQNVYEVQQKYDFEKVQNKANADLRKKRDIIDTLASVIFVIAVVFIILLIKLWKKKRSEEDLNKKIIDLEYEIDKIRDLQVEYEEQIKTLKENLKEFEKEKNAIMLEQGKDDHDTKERTLVNEQRMNALRKELDKLQAQYDKNRKQLEDYLERRIKLALIIQRDDKSIDSVTNSVLYKSLKSTVFGAKENTLTEAMFLIFEEVYPGLAQKIRKRYPELNDTEYKVCLYSFLPMTVHDIAEALGQSDSNIGKAKTSIRRKLGMAETGADFCEHILLEINAKHKRR